MSRHLKLLLLLSIIYPKKDIQKLLKQKKHKLFLKFSRRGDVFPFNAHPTENNSHKKNKTIRIGSPKSCLTFTKVTNVGLVNTAHSVQVSVVELCT